MDKSGPPPPYGDWQQQQHGAQQYPQQQYPMQQQQQQQYPMQQQQQQQYPMQQFPMQQQQQQHQQYPPQPVQQQPQQVVTQVIVTGNVQFHQSPVSIMCPHCQNVITTTTHSQFGPAPWLICVGLVLLGFWLGCCIIPFFIKSLKDVEHKCPNCRKVVGKYSVM